MMADGLNMVWKQDKIQDNKEKYFREYLEKNGSSRYVNACCILFGLS